MTKKTDFAAWLERQLRIREMTQAEFARLGGVSTSQVSQFLSGWRGPGEKIFEAVARAFELPLVEVYRTAGVLPVSNGNDPHPTPEDQYILAMLKGLTPGQRGEVLDFIGYLKRKEG